MNSQLIQWIVATACFGFVDASIAQNYPSKPIRLVIPFAAGGTFDYVGRVISEPLTEDLGQQVVVDNRPGGGTVIATEIVANASADGLTLLLGSNVLAINPSLKKNLPYDVQKDLVPIALLATQAFAIGAANSFPPNSVQELISAAQANPNQISFATAGLGSTGHIAAELFMSMSKTKMIHVGYKSGGQSVLDVIANQIPLVFTGLPNVYTHMKNGRLKILGITERKRSDFAPDIPTVAETVPGYEFSNWFGILAPAGTPRQITTLLEAELLKIMRMPDIRQKLASRGFGLVGASAREFASTLESDTKKYAKVVKDANIQVTF